MAELFGESVSESVKALVELFHTELSGVKFPDLDGAVLGKAVSLVESHAGAVLEAEQALDRARSELGDAQEALLQKAHRALAYLRIYADEKPELLARLDTVALPKLRRPPSSRTETLRPGGQDAENEVAPRRRRVRKDTSADAPLLIAEDGTPERAVA